MCVHTQIALVFVKVLMFSLNCVKNATRLFWTPKKFKWQHSNTEYDIFTAD